MNIAFHLPAGVRIAELYSDPIPDGFTYCMIVESMPIPREDETVELQSGSFMVHAIQHVFEPSEDNGNSLFDEEPYVYVVLR